MAGCPQFGALSASSGGWGQFWGRTMLPVLHPQSQFCEAAVKSLTPVMESWSSTLSANPVREARDNMLAGLFRGKAGQVTTTTTNRLLESEDSLK
jgi:hypothetical protein